MVPVQRLGARPPPWRPRSARWATPTTASPRASTSGARAAAAMARLARCATIASGHAGRFRSAASGSASATTPTAAEPPHSPSTGPARWATKEVCSARSFCPRPSPGARVARRSGGTGNGRWLGRRPCSPRATTSRTRLRRRASASATSASSPTSSQSRPRARRRGVSPSPACSCWRRWARSARKVLRRRRFASEPPDGRSGHAPLSGKHITCQRQMGPDKRQRTGTLLGAADLSD
mmetsp:Transcript_13947/g.49095  ORF Transcript_13947/g.49095 Transcript_13947/m.49095 type:complete len:236 (-) Transcript_13947:160-867(-)